MIKCTEIPSSVFRISRGDPWILRPPSKKNRFDISTETGTSTVYVGGSQEAAFAEVLGDFWPLISAEVSRIPADDDFPNSNFVPAAWAKERSLGTATVRVGISVADINQLPSLTHFRGKAELVDAANDAGFAQIDEATVRASGPNGRKFTQALAAYIYSQNFDGILYKSRLDSRFECFAFFLETSNRNAGDSESFTDTSILEKEISPSNPSLLSVLKDMGLSIKI